MSFLNGTLCKTDITKRIAINGEIKWMGYTFISMVMSMVYLPLFDQRREHIKELSTTLGAKTELPKWFPNAEL